MLKNELIESLEREQKKNADLIRELQQMKSDFKDEMELLKSEFTKKEYETWKASMNPIFMKRFIKEIVNECMDNLSISCNGDYGGYFDVSLYYGKRQLSSADARVHEGCNPLDE